MTNNGELKYSTDELRTLAENNLEGKQVRKQDLG